MIKSIYILLRYYFFWVLFSVLARAGFLIYNHEQASAFSIPDILNTFLYGLKLDLCVSAYFLLIPIVLLSFSFLIKKTVLIKIFNIYTAILLVLSVFVVMVDFELYRNWGFRMDKTPLLYLTTPGEALASTKAWITIVFILSILLVSAGCYIVYLKFVAALLRNEKSRPSKKSLFLFVLLPVMILPIRGGFGVATLNASAVYFHTNPFLNHSAINVVWNVGYSLTISNSERDYTYLPKETARDIFQELQQKNGETHKVLNTDKPNVIIIILESFTAKIIGSLGGKPGVCPNFDSLCHEGILFEHFYANGDRSDKGIVSILSGYPAQPGSSIIKFPDKTQHLPFLNRELGKAGYSSAFYYGGDLAFANMKSYFVNGGYHEIITLDNFPKNEMMGKWGIPDGILFDRFIRDIDHSQQPFFKALFTLSSHEPFEVPMETVFQGNDEESRFMNAAHYSDKCLGAFIRQAKSKSWWGHTLVVLLADHGHRLPGDSKLYEEQKFSIPMLWLGGALQLSDTIVSTYGSQIDVPKSILGQLQLDVSAFEFGKDIFDPVPEKFAFYVFNDGFGFANKEFTYIHDNVSDTAITFSGNTSKNNADKGIAYLQVLMEDYRDK